MHKVAGQNRIVTKICRPEPTGLVKRMVLVFGNRCATEDPEAASTTADDILQNVHNWMFGYAHTTPGVHTLKENALPPHQAQK